jgi:putative glutamine amidotransferase
MKIALTQTESPEKHQLYINWLKGDEEDIEVVTLSADKRNQDELNTCDALVLSGGVDINPALYGGALDYANQPEKGFRTDRDLFEQSLLKSALEANIPVLGICRGLQLMNVVLNGTLVQDLGDDRLNKIHRGGPDKQHAVQIEQGSLLHELTGVNVAQVNSAHHQSIDKPGDGLMVNCRAGDGTIEGIEWADKAGKSFLLGVQWHPERMSTFNLQSTPLAANIRNTFLDAIRNLQP